MRKPIEHCETCGAPRVVYRRSIRRAQAWALAKLADVGPCKIGDLPDLPHGTYSDFVRLRLWGVIREVEEALWEVTTLGRDWLHGRCTLPQHLWTYRNRLMPAPPGEDTPQLHVWDVAPEILTKAQAIQHARNHSDYIEQGQLVLFPTTTT